MSRDKHWIRRIVIAATLALSSALALAGPASAKWIW
jgi:hypothetical protein